MKKYFSTGLVFLLPFALTFLLARYLFDALTDPFSDWMEEKFLWSLKENNLFLFRHNFVIKLLSQLISLIFIFFFIVFVGFLGRRFFFTMIFKKINGAISRIPVIGSIYKLIKDMTKSFFSLEKKIFQETVLIPFPHAQSYCIGFITGEAPVAIKTKIPEIDVIIFIPTAPHPIAGYVVFSSKTFVHSIDCSTEDVFKFLVSCGTLPFEKK